MFYKLNALMLAVVFLSSCSNIVQLKKEAHNQIRSVENIIVIEQDNLYVTVTSFYNGGGGAIGALIASSIDSSRQSSATEKAQPIIKELDDYNFKNVFLTAIKDKINKTHLPYKMSNQVESINSASNKRIHLLKTNSDALLVSNIDYALNAGNLIISARVSLYPKATNLKKFMKNSKNENTFDMTDIDNTIYNKNFTFTKQSISVGNIKNSLNEGAKNISEQIIDDLSHPI